MRKLKKLCEAAGEVVGGVLEGGLFALEYGGIGQAFNFRFVVKLVNCCHEAGDLVDFHGAKCGGQQGFDLFGGFRVIVAREDCRDFGGVFIGECGAHVRLKFCFHIFLYSRKIYLTICE